MIELQQRETVSEEIHLPEDKDELDVVVNMIRILLLMNIEIV